MIFYFGENRLKKYSKSTEWRPAKVGQFFMGHPVSIEKGRHNNLHLSERTCPFCPEQIENELHFLISCPTYESLRTRLIDDVELLCIGFFYPQNEDFLFWLLLNNPIISESKYIWPSLELREFLLNQHRNNA